MTITLEIESTSSPVSIPTQIDFLTWINYPQKSIRTIEYLRRLGSNEMIRQDTGQESMQQSGMAYQVFQSLGDYDTFVDDLVLACEKSTFWKFIDNENLYEVEHVVLMNFTHRPKKLFAGGIVGDGSDGTTFDQEAVYVEFQLNFMVDGDNA